MKRFLAAVTLSVLPAVLGVYAPACDSNAESHVYVASLYETANDCLDPSTSLGYIDTPNGDLDCAPTCIVFPPAPTVGGMERIYVSSMCGPYPANADISGTDPGCAAALAAWASGGPGSCNAGPTDGGASDDGGADAAMPMDSASNDAPSSDAPSSDDGGSAVDASDASDGGGTLDAPAE